MTEIETRHLSTAAILAGGKSTRMGFDKQFMRFNDQYLMEHIIIELKKAFDRIIIISNSPEMKQLAKPWGAEVYEDIILDTGPLGGIYTALHYSCDDMIYVTACDMPNIDSNYINAIKAVATSSQVDGVVAQIGNYMEPFQAFYAKTLMKEIKNALQNGERGIQAFLRKQNVVMFRENEIVKVCGDLAVFKNINDLESHIEAKRQHL